MEVPLQSWRQFKICGPLGPVNKEVLEWVVFGQRSDGAVFWNMLTVTKVHELEHGMREAFWMRAAIAFERFDSCYAHAQAPSKSFIAFKNVGVWFKDPDGDWHFK